MSNNKCDGWIIFSEILPIMREQSDAVGELIRDYMIAPESPLVKPFFLAESSIVEMIADLVGCKYETISWFILDCNFGRNAMEAGISGDMRMIDSVEKLRWLVELEA